MKEILMCGLLIFLVACVGESAVKVSSTNHCFEKLMHDAELGFASDQLTAEVMAVDENRTYLDAAEYSRAKSNAGQKPAWAQVTVKERYESQVKVFYEILEREFGLKQNEFTILSAECSIGRGGFVNATGVDKDGESFSVYHHYGWCSSGGSNCGWDGCIRTGNDAFFESVKAKWCSSLSSKQWSWEDYTIISDDTNETREKCLAGAFEETGMLSITQISSGRTDRVENGVIEC